MKKLMLFLPLIFLCAILDAFSQDKSEAYNKLEKECLIEAHHSPKYKKVFMDVHELQGEVRLAKSGILKKTGVINHYNSTVGLYMGQSHSFNKVDMNVNKKGDALIKMFLLKCASEVALEKASADF